MLIDFAIESHQRVVIINGLIQNKSLEELRKDLRESINGSWLETATKGNCIYIASKDIPGPNFLVIAIATTTCTFGASVYPEILLRLKIEDIMAELNKSKGLKTNPNVLQKRLSVESCAENLALSLLKNLEQDQWPKNWDLDMPQPKIKKICDPF